MSRGLVAVVAAFVSWGLVPLFWRLLGDVPTPELLAHRVVFCALFVGGWLTLGAGVSWVEPARRSGRVASALVLSSALIAINGGLYIYGVNTGQVVATSLGYFVNPLVNVLLGVLLLGERLRPAQWVAVAIATAGVVYLSVRAGALPWLSLALALSFGIYGLVRKTIAIDAMAGLGLEGMVLLPAAVAYLVWTEVHGGGSFGHAGASTSVLLVLSGIVTAAPLAAFSYGARLLPYSTVGIVQYVAPSLQLACAVFVFGEPFPLDRAMGFGLIWCALAVYAADALRASRTPAPA